MCYTGSMTQAKDTHSKDADLNADIARLEALLFVSGDPLSTAKCARVCGFSREHLAQVVAAHTQRAQRTGSGLRISVCNDTVQMVTAPHTQQVVEKLVTDARNEDLSKAALEVLAIVAYRSPVSRAEVDAIRGVNCAFSLRNLLMRGLIERVPDPNRPRAYLYRVTHDFLSHLGLQSVEELPDFTTLSTHPKIAQVKGESEETC